MKPTESIIEIEQNDTDEIFEKCVICQRKNEYIHGVPISERNYFVEGAGQLCKKCYYDLYVKKWH